MPLNPDKLQHVRPQGGGGYIAQCPCCHESGGDNTGNHLRVYADGKYGCCVDSSPEHSKRIWQLAGAADGEIITHIEPLPKIELPRTWSVDCLKRLIQDPTYWRGRGVSDEVIESLRGGVATEGQLKNRWVIPIFNDGGEIVGFTARALKPDMSPKYKHLGRVGEWTWGGLKEIAASRRAVIVESPADYMILTTHGVKDVIVLFGVNMSQAVLSKLISLNVNEIVISTNKDERHEVGQRAAEQIRRSLLAFFDESSVRIMLPPRKDWGECGGDEIRVAFALDKQTNLTTVEE